MTLWWGQGGDEMGRSPPLGSFSFTTGEGGSSMSYDELLAQVYAALPQLKGQLHAPRVVYVQSQGKVYITFESNVLVEEASFLKLEALLRRVFPQKPLVK